MKAKEAKLTLTAIVEKILMSALRQAASQEEAAKIISEKIARLHDQYQFISSAPVIAWDTPRDCQAVVEIRLGKNKPVIECQATIYEPNQEDSGMVMTGNRPDRVAGFQVVFNGSGRQVSGAYKVRIPFAEP